MPREVLEAELHRVKFARELKRHPTSGRSFFDACVMGTVSLIDEFAAPGEGVSQLLVDAVKKGQGEVACTLLTAYANPNYRTSAGETPLLMAAFTGNAAIARSLLTARADADLAFQDGATPMLLAAENGHVEVVRALLEARADANKAKQNGATPLIAATQKGHVEVVRALREAGVEW